MGEALGNISNATGRLLSIAGAAQGLFAKPKSSGGFPSTALMDAARFTNLAGFPQLQTGAYSTFTARPQFSGQTALDRFANIAAPGAPNQPIQGFLVRTAPPTVDPAKVAGLLGTNILNFRNLLPGIQALEPEVKGLQGTAAGFFGKTAAAGTENARLLGETGALAGEAGAIGGKFGDLESELARLQGEVRPGFGRLTEAQVTAVRNRAAESAGNLRESLAKRNLSGSSFANQELNRIGLDFAQEEERVRAEAFTQELDQTRQYAALRAQVLAGQLGTVEERRAIIDEGRALVDQAGNLLQLDQQTLSQQAQLVGLRLGLSEAQSTVFANELANIQTQMSLAAQEINRELSELGIAASLSGASLQAVTDVGNAQAKLAADSAYMQGLFNSLSGTRLTNLGQAVTGFGEAAGKIDFGGFGEALSGSKTTGSTTARKAA